MVVVGVWWNVIDVIVWHAIGIVCGLLVGFQWSITISWRMGVLEEQDGVVVGVFWPSQLPVH